MTDLVRPRVKYVIGPDGSPLTIADLPPTNTRRWVIRRKAEVVAAVEAAWASPGEWRQVGAHANAVLQANRGSTARVVDALDRILSRS